MLENNMVNVFETEEARPLEECDGCGLEIFEGDTYYKFADEVICEECLASNYRYEAGE